MSFPHSAIHSEPHISERESSKGKLLDKLMKKIR